MALSLIACGGGGSETPAPVIPDQPIQSTGSISGYVAPIPRNADLSIVSETGDVNESIQLDEHGFYEFSGSFTAGNYTLNLNHSGLKEVDGTYSKSGTLQVPFEYQSSGFYSVNVTPFSALTNTNPKAGISEWLGFDPVKIAPTPLNNEFFRDSTGSEALYSIQVGALSELSKSLGGADTQEVYELMEQDLSADNMLDGNGQNGLELKLNGNPISGNTYREAFALSIVESAKQEINITGIKNSVAIDKATDIANSNSSILTDIIAPIVIDGETSESFDFNLNISNNDTIHGDWIVELTSDDLSVVSSVSVKSGVKELANSTTHPDKIEVVLDTNQISDGAQSLIFTVETLDGNSYLKTVNVNVFNTLPSIELNSDLFVTSAVYNAEVVLSGQQVGLISVKINTSNATLDGPYYTSTIVLNSGVNTLTVDLEFNNRDTITKEFSITVDNQPPSVDQIYHEYVTGYQVNYFRTADNVTEKRYLTMDSSYPFFITHGSASLNGLAPTVQNLMDKGYSFYQGKINDHYTDHSDLTVKYSVSLDGSVISENVNLQIDDQGIFVIPLTTEYLSQNLKTVTISNQYTIIVEATDEANNTTTKQYGFYVKFAEYSISPSKIYDEDAVVSGNITYSPEGFFTDAVRVTLISGENRYDAIDPTNPSFSLATSALGSGDVSFTIEVETSFGTTYSEVISLNVDNVSPTVNTELNVEATGGTHTFNGTVSDDYGISSLKLDGEYLAFDNSTGQFEFTKTLNSGTQFFQIEALDFSGNATRISVQANYDPNRPEFGLVSPLSGNQKLWATMASGGTQKINFQLSESNTYLIYQGNASFSGLSETVNNLNNNSIPYVEFTAKDKLVNGSFVNPVVSYELSKNGGVVKAATVLAPKTGYSYILPLTTEYLGAHLTTAIASDFYSLKIIMTNDGDTREVSFDLKFKASVTTITNSWTAEKVFSDTTPSAVLLGNDVAGLTESKLTINGVDYFAADPNILSFNPDLTALNDGLHSAVLSLSDRLGLTHTENMSFNLDTTAPTFTHNLPEMTDVYDFTVSGIVSDNISGVSRLQIDGNDVMFDTNTGEYSYDIEIDSAAGSQQNVKNYDSAHEFILTDNQGNATTYDRTVIVDRMGGFIWNQGVNISGHTDTQCDGTLSTSANWHGDPTEEAWIVYADTKTLGGTGINNDSELNNKSIGYFRFWAWGHVYEYFDMLPDLSTLTYTYKVNNEPVFSDRALSVSSVLGDKNVNEFRIALTEEYLGTEFYKTSPQDTHKIEAKLTDNLGNVFKQDYQFKICNYVDLGINKH